MAKITDEEKQSSEYLEHRLGWRRMWWEKTVLASFMAVALFFGHLIYEDFKTDLTLAVENFKADLTVSRFLLEERLKGLKEIRAAYNEITDCTESCFLPASKRKDKQYDDLYEKYQSKLTNFKKVINEWSLLYPDNFSKTLAGHNNIHNAIAYKKIVLNEEHFNFLFSICQNFDYVTRIALYKSTLGQKDKTDTGIFQFHKDSVDKLSKLSSKEFFNINLEKHKKENPKK